MLIVIFLFYVCIFIVKFGGEGYGGWVNVDLWVFFGLFEGFCWCVNNV